MVSSTSTLTWWNAQIRNALWSFNEASLHRENVGLTCPVLILDQLPHVDDIFNILQTLAGQLLPHRLSRTLGLGCGASTTAHRGLSHRGTAQYPSTSYPPCPPSTPPLNLVLFGNLGLWFKSYPLALTLSLDLKFCSSNRKPQIIWIPLLSHGWFLACILGSLCPPDSSL